MKKLSQTKFIIYTNLFLAVFYNYSFYLNTMEVYPVSLDNIFFLFSLVFMITAFNVIMFTLVSMKFYVKTMLILVLNISAVVSYFMNTYSIVINTNMIRNIVQTNLNESMELFSLKLILYILLFGILPSYFILKTTLEYKGFKAELISRLKVLIVCILVIVVLLLTFSKHYASFFREHKILRYSINPTNWIYSISDYTKRVIESGKVLVEKIGTDAIVEEEEDDSKELVIMVVGEAARADHFSLNGYLKETNPLLKKEKIFNFSNMYSCGTSTAESVPCMFSIFNKSDYSYKKGISTQNILDVFSHTDYIDILWRDNNSDSKGVATRIKYEGYKGSENNTVCDIECRDEGMLVGLDDYIKEHKGKDILIVLHQMGNHGPAYYKRYPKNFEKFKPVCKTNQLEKCSQDEISNAYDNALLYTDYFLSKTINFLKKYDKTHETALIYMSDHGESLGENGVYLHGLPYLIAPDSQKHIGAFMWFGKEMLEDIDTFKLEKKSNKLFTHDNLFHTLLGLFEVKTSIYDKSMDILNND